MQKVQRWSQPFCTSMKARVRSAKPSKVGAAVARGVELLGVAEDEIDLGHGGEAFGLDLRRAAGHDDARFRVLLAGPPDRLKVMTCGAPIRQPRSDAAAARR
jgi:hypothetical protein